MASLDKRLDELEKAASDSLSAPAGIWMDIWRAYGEKGEPLPTIPPMTIEQFNNLVADAIRRAYGKDRPEIN